jgi:ribosomal protein S18 acetylase RimI-like enzyme
MQFEELFTIRLCNEADAPRLAPLIQALAVEEGVEAADLEAVETIVSALLQSGASDFLLATIEGRPVGCMQIAYRLSTWRAAPYAYIEDFYLAPEARARGIGTKLLDYALQRADGRDMDHIALDVRSANRAALRLYARFGFAESGSMLLTRPLPLGESYSCDTEGVGETVAALRGDEAEERA